MLPGWLAAARVRVGSLPERLAMPLGWVAVLLAWLGALAFLPAALHAQVSESLGPLRSGEGSPVQRLAFTPIMDGAELLSDGALSFELRNGVSNIFEQDSSANHLLFVDMERLLTSVVVRYGLTERVELGVSVTLETTGGGVLDGPVSGMHNALGLGNGDRGAFPENSYRQVLERSDGLTVLEARPRTLALDEVRLTGRWRAATSADGRSVLSLRGDLRVPRNHNLAAEEGADGALAALGRLGLGERWHLHGMLGASYHRVDPALGDVLNSGGWFATLGAERSLGSSLAALVQLGTQSAALRDFGEREIDWPSTNIVLGMAGALGENWRWQLFLQEDLPADTPAVDFTFGVGIRKVW